MDSIRATVYGSSSQNTPKAYVDAAYNLGKSLAESSMVCVNGGGRFGCMGAMSAGCRAFGGKVIGVIHEMWVIDSSDDGLTQDMIVSRGNDLTERKQLLIDNGDCIIVLPGGVGTLDELWEAVSAKSLRMKGLANKPICVININGFFDGCILQLKRAYEDKLLYLPLEDYFHVVDTPEAAVAWSQMKLLELTQQKENNNTSDKLDNRMTRRKVQKSRLPLHLMLVNVCVWSLFAFVKSKYFN